MKLKVGLSLIVATLVLAPQCLIAGDHANNGGGSAEQNIVFAFQYFGQFAQNCLNNEICGLSAADRDVLNKIRAALPDEGEAQDLLVFRTSSEDDFLLDGAVRVAKTGSTVGSKIFVNRAMIYELYNGKPSPIGVPQAAALLVHELGHHQGIADHTYLDLLGAKLRIFLQRSVISLNFDPRLFLTANAFQSIPFIPSFTVVYLRPDDRLHPETRLLINDSATAIDLSDRVLPSLIDYSRQNEANNLSPLCAYKDANGITKKGDIIGFDLLGPRWEQSYYYKPFGQPPVFLLRLNFVLDVICKAEDVADRWIPKGLLYEIKLIFDRDGDKLVFDNREHLNPIVLERDPFH